MKSGTGTPIAALLKEKQHFEALDGLRGVAAISVVVFHFMEWVVPDYSKSFIGHGHLAVDFFFCLSGFVIAYAYDDRIRRMGIGQFLLARLIRLQPMVVFGSTLGLLALFFDPFAAHKPVYSAGRVVVLFLTSIFLIPYPVMADRLYNLFGLNAPAWSLFWEYLANVAYAVILFRMGRRSLIVVTTLAAAVLCLVSHQAGTLSVGWGGSTFWDGGARVAYSFSAGMLVYRSRWIVRSRLSFTALSILLLAPFVMPYLKWNWLVESLVVVFYFPLLIALGAGATLTPRSESLCIFSGNISYPLYMTHYAVIWMFANYYGIRKPGMLQAGWIVTASVVLLIAIAYLVLVAYDVPTRAYLGALRRKAAGGVPRVASSYTPRPLRGKPQKLGPQ